MKVALFSLVESINEIREYMGISYIKAYLNEKNIECSSQVIYKEEFREVIADLKNVNGPILIGVAMYCNTVGLVKEFCKDIKKECKDCYISVGGPQVMGFETEILKDCVYVDFVVTGEGEETYLDLITRLNNNMSLHECDGISFRSGSEIVINKSRKPIENLDVLPLPYREMNKNNKKRYFYIVGSRGCLGRCTFCAEYITGGSNVRLRTPKNIVDEIEMLQNKYGYNKFHFTDATFEDPGEAGVLRAKGIFKEIIKRKLSIRMVMYTRCQLVQLFDDDYYELAYNAGVECFFVGIESGNDHDMKIYSKRADVQDNLKAIKKILKHNIYVNYGFINFNPYSTFDTLKENLMFLKTSGLIYNTYHFLSKLTIMPQAPMKTMLIRDGLLDEFHYDSDITKYRFQHPEVKGFYDSMLKGLNKMHLIDYDSQIYIDYNHFRKEYNEIYQKVLKVIFDEIFLVWKERSNYLYDFFTECIDCYIKTNYSSDELEKLILKQNINQYDKRLKQLYIKYLKEAYKLGINTLNLTLV